MRMVRNKTRPRPFSVRPRLTILLAVATACATAGVVWAFAASAASAPPSPNVDQAALAKCMSQSKANCESQVPGLAECMSQQLVCNQAAEVDRKAHYGPLNTPSGLAMTQTEATSRALMLSSDSSKATAIFVHEMSLNSFVTEFGRQPAEFGTVSMDRMVWVVTVHAPIYTDAAPFHPPYLKDAYTVIFDAASRTGIEVCIGCATLTG
jgi:hypothetical protein